MEGEGWSDKLEPLVNLKGGFSRARLAQLPTFPNVEERLFPGTQKCQSFDGSVEYLHNLAVLGELELIVRPEWAGLSDSINPNLGLIMYAIEF